nr:hypothetical protein [Tanacetum cinerariifolium]
GACALCPVMVTISCLCGETRFEEKAMSDNKRLRCSTAVEMKRTPRETKAPKNSMQKLKTVLTKPWKEVKFDRIYSTRLFV